MTQIAVLERKCDGCGLCARACPFDAIEMRDGIPYLNAGCRVCGACVKACARGALIRLETRSQSVDKQKWNGILVYAEQTGGRLHPVSMELIGCARSMHERVRAVLPGTGAEDCAREMLHYGVEAVYTYDDAALGYFRADVFADCVADAIADMRPGVVLMGATALGRSLAPRLAARFHTGLTADCTGLSMRPNSDLIQVRPAFGGNIMAQIVTGHTRPQFATVRYKVMEAPARAEQPSGAIIARNIPHFTSTTTLLRATPIPPTTNISDADVLVVGGRGFKKEADLRLIRELAALLGGEWATSRPLVEKGWNSNMKQIGLSGRTVRPKLLIAAGVSGAIQFVAGMDRAEHIIAINEDADAPIFSVAHVGIVGDLYRVLPELIASIKEARGV